MAIARQLVAALLLAAASQSTYAQSSKCNSVVQLNTALDLLTIMKSHDAQLKALNTSIKTIDAKLGDTGCPVKAATPQNFNFVGAKCSSHSPYHKQTGTSSCKTPSGILHWDQWFAKGNKNGYFQVSMTDNLTIAMVGFSLTVSRGPAFEILYSDDAQVWTKAAEVKKATVNSNVKWGCRGRHKHWRYHLTGDWKGGPWYYNLKWAYVGTIAKVGAKTVGDKVSFLESEIIKVAKRVTALEQRANTNGCAGGKPNAWNYVGATCGAYAPFWKGSTSCATDKHQLHWDQWYKSSKGNGYFQVNAAAPIAMVGFSMTCSRGPAYAIKYSDDKTNWYTAAKVSVAAPNPSVTWSCIGKHKYWRYEITGDWKGGPWYENLKWLVEGTADSGCPSNKASLTKYNFADAVCSAHAPHWKNAGTHGCATPSGALHWDQWFNSKNTNGYFQVHAPGPIAMTKFALTVGRGPAFEIMYSDDGDNWAKAAENKKSSVNSVITWPCVGKHAYWRYHITGDWKGGPWYHSLNWYYVGQYTPACSRNSIRKYTGSAACSAWAPYWKGGSSCSVRSGILHWDQWYTSSSKLGYFQIATASATAMVKFTMTCGRSPAYKIKFSDDGTSWGIAYTKAATSVNPVAQWSCVGKHKYWRYEMTGDWKGGPWYHSLNWYHVP